MINGKASSLVQTIMQSNNFSTPQSYPELMFSITNISTKTYTTSALISRLLEMNYLNESAHYSNIIESVLIFKSPSLTVKKRLHGQKYRKR